MDIKLFNETYKEKGGIAKLNEMKALLLTTKFISDHFGVSKERVKQWFNEIWKEPYDPRPTRRQLIIESMIAFAKANTESEFYHAFRYHNEDYFICALVEIYQRNIYKK